MVRNDGVGDTTPHETGMGLRLASVEALQYGGVVEFGRVGDDEWQVRLLVPLDGADA